MCLAFCITPESRPDGACHSLPNSGAAAACDEIDQVAIERGRQQTGDEVLEVAGFPVGFAEGATEYMFP